MANIDRKELVKTQDSFITSTGTIVQWIKNNPFRFIIAVLIIVFLAGGISGFYYWKTSREDNAFSSLVKAGSNSKQIGEVASKYADTKAGKISKLRLAGQAFDKSDFKEAIRNADEFIDSWGTQDILLYQAMMIRAMSYIELKDMTKALDSLDKCEKGAAGVIKDQAVFLKAIELNASGKKNEAIALLKTLSAEPPKVIGEKKADIKLSDTGSSQYRDVAKATLSDIAFSGGAGSNAK
jgi:predicted negative regulator of RcsB-dependent stress response